MSLRKSNAETSQLRLITVLFFVLRYRFTTTDDERVVHRGTRVALATNFLAYTSRGSRSRKFTENQHVELEEQFQNDKVLRINELQQRYHTRIRPTHFQVTNHLTGRPDSRFPEFWSKNCARCAGRQFDDSDNPLLFWHLICTPLQSPVTK